jgi:lipoprotein
MKKIAVLLLLVLALAGCGKKANGIFTVQNNSSHPVTFKIGQDYRIEEHSIGSGDSKDIPWKQYVLFYSVSPKNIISYTQSNNKAVIKDTEPCYEYIIQNNVCDNLNIIDGPYKNGDISEADRKFLLSDNGLSVKQITIAKGEKTIKCFNELSTNDIILLGKELTILQSESVSEKEEKCRECNTEGGHSFFYKIVKIPTARKNLSEKKFLLKLKKGPQTDTYTLIYINIR